MIIQNIQKDVSALCCLCHFNFVKLSFSIKGCQFVELITTISRMKRNCWAFTKKKRFIDLVYSSQAKNEQKDFKDNGNSSLPVDGGYPLVRPLNAPIEETDDAAEVALPNWVADPEQPPYIQETISDP